jgi:hypothetical protein
LRRLKIAAEYGRGIAPVEDLKLPDTEQQILDRLVVERGISPDLVKKLLLLVLQDHLDLRVWGSKAAVQREIEQAIEASLVQTDATGDGG